MGLLVDDLLLLARMDVQRPLEHNRVDLLALASDAVHDGRAIDPERAITMEVFDGPGTPEVLGDEPRLRQVLGNLVANALEAMPQGGRLRVGTELRADGLALTVADTGPGLDDDQRQRLFTPYYTTKPGGTGLGLAIVQSIVSDHGGRIEVASERGRGTTFTLIFPLPA